MRTDLIFIKDKAAEIIDDINSLDNIKKIGISQFIETSYNIQKNAEKLCLSARLLPLKSGFSKAKQEIEKTMIKETENENEPIDKALEIAENYSGYAMVGSLFISSFISFFVAIILAQLPTDFHKN